MWFFKTPPPRTLSGILQLERNLILSGQIDQLGRLNSQKERLLKELETGKSKPTSEELQNIRKLAQQNLRLIEAAKSGVQSVRKRLNELNRMVEGSDTYGRDGQRKTHSNSTPNKTIIY